MTDEEVKRAQIAENLLREDVHPIEEAEGYQALMRDHGVTADQLAEQTGKSRSYVYGRLKLLQACPEIRDACLAGDITSEVTLLIARLRTDKLQRKALGYIKGKYWDLKDGGKGSYRQIRALLIERFTLDLDKAIFATDDADLVPEAGPCTTCPKRTGNAPEFTDVVERPKYENSYLMLRSGQEKGSADICTDPDCFAVKKTAHLKIEAKKLTKDGKEVLRSGRPAAQRACGSGRRRPHSRRPGHAPCAGRWACVAAPAVPAGCGRRWL